VRSKQKKHNERTEKTPLGMAVAREKSSEEVRRSSEYRPLPEKSSEEVGRTIHSTLPNVQSNLSVSEDSIPSFQKHRALQDKFEIDFNELECKDELGKGAYGVIYRAIWRNTEVAVKKLQSSTLSVDQMKDFQSEVKIMTTMKPHTNVLLFMGACTRSPPYCIVMQYINGGSLRKLLDVTQFSLEMCYQILKDIANGLYHLHVEGIVHRDLASRNILMKETVNGFEPKIGDFGLSRILMSASAAETTQSDTGPLRIMAPECIIQKEYSFKSDVWAFGVLITEVYSHKDPYPHLSPLQVAGLVARGELSPEIPSQAPSDAQKMVIKCCKFDANERPTMKDICQRFSSNTK